MSFKRYALALHTSSPELGLALSNFSGDSRCETWDLGRSLSTDLHYYLQEFLQPQGWSDLAFLAIAKGPGGFTGTRIGVVTARTLAQQLGIPLFAISSLAAFAYSVRDRLLVGGGNGSDPPVDFAVQMPAQRGELFTAIYGTQSVLPELAPEQVPEGASEEVPEGTPEEILEGTSKEISEAILARTQKSNPDSAWTALFPDTVLSSEQWQQVLDQWQRPYQLVQAEGGLGGSVASLLQLAYRDWCSGVRPPWAEALPFYGQHPVTR